MMGRYTVVDGYWSTMDAFDEYIASLHFSTSVSGIARKAFCIAEGTRTGTPTIYAVVPIPYLVGVSCLGNR
jgi:hypothetical protein